MWTAVAAGVYGVNATGIGVFRQNAALLNRKRDEALSVVSESGISPILDRLHWRR